MCCISCDIIREGMCCVSRDIIREGMCCVSRDIIREGMRCVSRDIIHFLNRVKRCSDIAVVRSLLCKPAGYEFESGSYLCLWDLFPW